MRWIVTAAAIFFATVGGAAAKCPTLDRVELCGSTACVAAPSGSGLNSFLATGVVPAQPAALQPYYEVWALYSDGSRRLSSFYVPGAAVVYGGDWMAADSRPSIRDLAVSIEPRPAPDVIAATIAGKRVQDPLSYISLFTAGRLTSRWSGFRGWLRIGFVFDRPNPWATTGLRVSRTGGFVWRDGWIYRIPNAVATRARRGLSLSG
jgi:hypothetical protein